MNNYNYTHLQLNLSKFRKKETAIRLKQPKAVKKAQMKQMEELNRF